MDPGDTRGLRVALLLGTSTGGVGRHVRSLAAGLAGRGARVRVVAPSATATLFRFDDVGAEVALADVADRPRPLRDARAVTRLRRLLRDADAVHAHGLRAGALAALALTGRRGPALIVTLHNAVVARGFVGATYLALEHVMSRRADLVLGVSPDLVARARGRGARAVDHALVPAPPLAAATRDAAAVRGELAATDRPLALCVARLAPQKGLDTLLEAVGCWPGGSRPDSRSGGRPTSTPLVAVVGDGPMASALAGRIARETLPVRLLGTRDDVPDLLAAADVVVVPSVWEGQPLAVQEALLAGTPLVATRVGGVPEMVGDAAVLVPAGDAAALARAIVAVTATPALADRLRRAARERAARLPSESDAVDQVVAAYRRVLGTRGP